MESIAYVIHFSVIISVIALIVLDIVVGVNRNPRDDISVLINTLSNGKLFCIPFAFGVVVAHLYFGHTSLIFPGDYDKSNIYGTLGAVAITVVLILIGLLFKNIKPSKLRVVVLLVAGLVYGHFCWTMHGV